MSNGANRGYGAGVSISGNGKNLALVAREDVNDAHFDSDLGRILLFTFDDTNFSNATLRGQFVYNASGSNNLDTGADKIRHVALDQDGDRLVYTVDGIRNINGHLSGTINGTAVDSQHRAFARTIKFDDTNFTNPQRVGVIGAFTGAAGSGNSPTVLSNDLDLYADSINSNYPKWSPDVELNADGSRMALTYYDYAQTGDAIHLISFSDTNFSSPSLTGRIGEDYTGVKDLDLSRDAAISQNRILNGLVGFGWDIELSSDATKLVALHNSNHEAAGMSRAKGIHLFTFSDGNFSNPTYVGAITSDDDISTSYQTGSKTDTGYTYNNNKILEDFDWGQYGEYGCYAYSCSHASIGKITRSAYGSSIHQIKIALSGDGTRLVISGRGSDDDSGLYLIGFSDSNFGNPEVKQIINPGIFKTSDSSYQDQYVGGSMSCLLYTSPSPRDGW